MRPLATAPPPVLAACAGRLPYAIGRVDRLPTALPLYPDARIAEAAGSGVDLVTAGG